MDGKLGYGSWGMSDADREALKAFAAFTEISAKLLCAAVDGNSEALPLVKVLLGSCDRIWDVLAPAGPRNAEREAILAFLVAEADRDPNAGPGEPE